MMIRVELRSQLLRLRTMIALAALAAVPVIAAAATASNAGHQNGTQGGLFGAGTFSALNHAAASLEFIGPLLLPVVVAMLCTAIGASDRDWGTLRYLYVQPVSQRRLLTSKFAAVVVVTAVTTSCVLLSGLLAGVVFFGWHPFHIIGAANLTTGASIARFVAAGGYTMVCMLSMGTIALMLGLVLPRPIEALTASIAFVIVASILDGQPAFHDLDAVLPVHYWQSWTHLYDSSGVHLGTGIAVQLAAAAVASAVAAVVLRRRDPAA